MSGIAAQRAESALNCRVIHVSVMKIVSRKTNKQTPIHFRYLLPPTLRIVEVCWSLNKQTNYHFYILLLILFTFFF